MKSTNIKHRVPDSIRHEAETALRFFPELSNIDIRFRFKRRIKKSTMLAQPILKTLFRKKANRAYVILISKTFKISGKTFLTKNIPSDIMIGWLGHELGHIMDYQNRSWFNLILFGIKYLFVEKHIVEAERAADTFAVKNGMYTYILKTKNFILNHSELDETYKLRIKKYYLSPEEIMEIVNKPAE